MATTCFSPISISGGSQVKARELFSIKSSSFAKTSILTVPRKSDRLRTKRNLSVRAEYDDGNRGGGGGDFFCWFSFRRSCFWDVGLCICSTGD